MPKPVRRTVGAGRRYCVNHGWRCRWAGGPWPDEDLVPEGRPEQCRQATKRDREREEGVYRPVNYSAEIDVAVVVLAAELNGEDGEEVRRRWHAEAPARAEARRVADAAYKKRRAAQSWDEWYAEEVENVAAVKRLVAEINARVQARPTEENER